MMEVMVEIGELSTSRIRIQGHGNEYYSALEITAGHN